jgi:hypothetical protein
VQRSNAETLELLLANVSYYSEVVVHYAYCDVQRFRKQFEFEVQFSQPINQVRPHLLGDELLIFEEVSWQLESFLFLQQEAGYFGGVLSHSLDVAHIE